MVPPGFTVKRPSLPQVKASSVLPVIVCVSSACIAHMATCPSRVKLHRANCLTHPDLTYDSICLGSPRPVTTYLPQTFSCCTTCAAAATAMVVGAMIPLMVGYVLRMLCAYLTAVGVASSGGLMIVPRGIFRYFGFLRSFTEC